MRIGVIGVIGGWSSEKLVETVAQTTDQEPLLIDVSDIRLDLEKGTAFYGDLDISTLDALIIKKIGAWYSPLMLDRLEILRFLEAKGLPIFSSPEKIMRVVDRLSCTVTLALNNIPMPPTIVTESTQEALAALKNYKEAVFKPLFSTKARGMLLLKHNKDAQKNVEDFAAEHGVMYVQKTIPLEGKDLGIVFMGGSFVAAYARTNSTESWNTTTASGGKYETTTPSKDILELARKAQAPFGLDFTCVDVAMVEDKPYVFEVSAFGGFKGVEQACSIDAAQLFTDYVLKQIKK